MEVDTLLTQIQHKNETLTTDELVHPLLLILAANNNL